jgi:hypothetical protein
MSIVAVSGSLEVTLEAEVFVPVDVGLKATLMVKDILPALLFRIKGHGIIHGRLLVRPLGDLAVDRCCLVSEKLLDLCFCKAETKQKSRQV